MFFKKLREEEERLIRSKEELSQTIYSLNTQLLNLQNQITEIQLTIIQKQSEAELLTANNRLLRKENNLIGDIVSLENSKAELRFTIDQLKTELDNTQGLIEMTELGMEYIPVRRAVSSIEKNITENQTFLAHLIHSGEVFKVNRPYRIDGSEAKGREFQKNYCENLLIGLDAYIRSKEKSVTPNNYNKTIDLIDTAFSRYSRKAEKLGFTISQEYLTTRIDILNLKLDLKLEKEFEREQIRKEKQRVQEEVKLIAEAEKARKELAEERKRWQHAFDKAIDDAARLEAQNKLKSIDKREGDIDYQLNHLQAGWLYCISTPAMPGMVKLGVTRRLDFTKRISELSSASVPFKFIVHGVTFSDNAFELEKAIHDYFDDRRVNKTNKHKEFFYVSPDLVLEVLRDKFNCEIHFSDQEENE